MFDAICKNLTTRQSLRRIARLDRHLKHDIGLGHIADPDRHEPLLMPTRGPFERDTA
ncbi:MAG: hypothetical protein GDA49_05255 [Rhodospirillales bacterium]|nr:hypothetical protein [Rhodospirillales bacterium]